ncbi:MAG: hypothetical protein ACRCWM_11865 [Sarcina sp.]
MKYIESDKKVLSIKILIPTLLLVFHYTLGIFLIATDSKDLPNIKGLGGFIIVIIAVGLVTFGKINLLFNNRLEQAFAIEYKNMEYEIIGENLIVRKDCVTEYAKIEDIQNITLKDGYFIIEVKSKLFVVPINNKDDEVMESIMESIKFDI